MIIGIESYCGDKLLVGKTLTFEEIKTAVNEIFEKNDEKSFMTVFCSRYGYKELPCSEGYAAYWIDLDTRCVLVTSYTFPKELDSAKVLYYTDRGTFEPVYYVGGAIAHNVVYLAICKYDNDDAYYVFQKGKKISYFERFTLAMIFAGILSNTFERLRTGAVLDYINLNFINFPVFNCADIFICTGAILLIFILFFKR